MKRTVWFLLLGPLLCPMGCRRAARPETRLVRPPERTVVEAWRTAAAAAEMQQPNPAPSDFRLIRARVKPYTVSPSLKEVANLKSFKKALPLKVEQEKRLTRNLFVCSPTNVQQLFHIYENNDYLNLPSFVTTDLVLQVYHIFYDFTLRSVETDSLMGVLKQLTEGMPAESLATWREVSDPGLRRAALSNIAYFGVAAQALGLKAALPSEAEHLVQQEHALMDKHEGFAVGAVFPYKVDYSQFVPRGHYTRTEDLKRFFRAMMWYGLAPFAVRYSGKEGLAEEQIRQGLLLVRSLHRAKLESQWATIYEPTAFYVGTADDLTPAEWKEVSDEVFGKDASATAFADARKLGEFVAAVEKLRPARIQARIALQDRMPDPKAQLRFMGQRYLPDSEVLQRLSVPIERVFPAGLDVMAVLGAERARWILDTYARLYNAGKWADYKPERARLIQEFHQLEAETWTSNLYWSWLHTLKALLEPVPKGFPSFMLNEAWQDKSVHTALASWSELRHDTILYGKQSAVECGDGERPPLVRGYVEPNVVFYNRLLRLTQQSKGGLDKRKLLSDRLKSRFERFEDLLTFLKRVSEKELRNEKLTKEEYEQIRYIGGSVESLTLSVMEGNPRGWFEVTSETDKNMAVIADVHTGGDAVLEEGVGPAYEILVIVPIEGKLSLTRGAVFSYYEFKHPMQDRLTDEKWQAMLKAGKEPDPPVWTKTFLAPTKASGTRSSAFRGYSSGC